MNFIYGVVSHFNYDKKLDIFAAVAMFLAFGTVFTIFFLRRRVTIEDRFYKAFRSFSEGVESLDQSFSTPVLNSVVFFYTCTAVSLLLAMLFGELGLTSTFWQFSIVCLGLSFAYFLARTRSHELIGENRLITFAELVIALQIFKTLYPAFTPSVFGMTLSLFLVQAIEIFFKFRSRRKLISWKSLSALPLISFSLLNVIPRIGGITVPTDDYHFGEILLTSHRFMIGDIPYVDFLPAHGLMNFVPGILSNAFTGEVAPISVAYFYFLLKFFSLVIAGMCLSRIVPLPVACLTLAIFSVNRTSYALLFALSLYATMQAFRKLSQTVLILAIASPTLLLYEVSVGAAFFPLIIGTLAILLTFKDNYKSIWRSPHVYLAIIAIIAQSFYLAQSGILIGLFNSLRENSAVNLEAYGLPWIPLFLDGLKQNLRVELGRMGWIPCAGLLMAASLFFLYLRRSADTIRLGLLLALWVTPSLLLITYSMGRVDPMSWSRTGLVTNLYAAIVFVFASILLMETLTERRKYLLTIMALSITYGYLIKAQGRQLLQTTTSTLVSHIPNDSRMDAEHKRTIQAVRNSIDDYEKVHGSLKRNEFLDLTNRNALYYYLAEDTDLEITAFYNMSHHQQQNRIFNALVSTKRNFILLGGAEIVHDAAPFHMRVPRIWKILAADKGLSLFRSEANGTLFLARSVSDIPNATLIPRNQWIEHIYHRHANYAPWFWMNHLPGQAGLNFRSAHYTINESKIIVSIAPDALFLKISGRCLSKEENWWKVFSSQSEKNYMDFRSIYGETNLLIPLSNWYYNLQPYEVQIESTCESFNVEKVETLSDWEN